MITTLPVTTAEIVNAVLPRNAAAKGVVAGKIAGDVYVIALSEGKIALKVSTGELSEGDSVALFRRGNNILVEKIPPQASQSTSPSADTVNVQTAPDSAALKLLADTAARQLKKQVMDKDTLDQLQRILSAVAKNPLRFGEDTVNAVADLKAIVAAMPSGGEDVAQTAREVADRIIKLGEKFAEKLKSGAGVVDVILRNGTKAQEGYYSFNNVKSAISWLSENKEIQENVPWRKLTQMFGNGPVVIKVYESAIGDMRASFIPPQQTGDELTHFAAGALRADVWKNVPGNVLTDVLYDRKEIPLSRLLEIDALLKESEQRSSGPAAPSMQGVDAQSPALRSKGYEAALSQWLIIALDKNAPLPQLISRVPQPSSQQIPFLLSTLDDVNYGKETTVVNQVRADDFSIRQETLLSAERPDTVLPDMFKRLGLDLESSLARGDDVAAEVHPQSLKAVLLSLLYTIESASGQTQNRPSAVLSAVNTVAAPDQERAAVAATAMAMRTSVSDICAALNRVFEEAVEQAGALSARARAAEGADTLRQLLDNVRLVQDLPEQIDNDVQTMMKTVSAEVERLVRAFQQTQTVAGPSSDAKLDHFAEAIGRQIMAEVNDIADRLHNLGRQVLLLEDRIPKDATSPANRQTEIQGSLKDAFKQLDTLARMVSDQALSASREITRRLEDLALAASKRLDATAGDTGGRQQHGGLDTLKQQVENALTRVEALQVLARQVPVADGQQQVISLPMKIEGRWTDVVVKFLKKKDSGEKKNRADRPVSVAIHVAPEMLGQIDVFMDYRGKKRFAMRMEFGKQSTRQWFENNKADFSAALERIGFTAFKIDMKETRRLRRDRDIAAEARNVGGRAQGVIDITA